MSQSSSASLATTTAPSVASFRDVRLLGEGAQARVYLVEHIDTAERCVVKRCTMASPTAAEQALREVDILCALSHPSITRIFAAWRDESPPPTLHILMEYADGGSLAQAIRARSAISFPFDEGIVCEYVAQIASALAYMHGQSVLHRDLKAANCFLTARNLIKVGDFGIAKTLEAAGPDGSGALARTTVGTPYYLAPELVSGEPYAYKADMWALGVLLYELLALRRPFEARTLPELALKIVNVDCPPLSPQTSGFSPEVLGLLMSLLRRDPTARPTAQHACDAPLVRRAHAGLHAQLRSLALLHIPSGVASSDEAPPTKHAPQSAAGPRTPPTSSGDGGPSTPLDVRDGAGGQGARAAACALRVQSLLGTEGGSAPGACVVTPPASAPDGTAMTPPTSVEANMRFSQNLHALELNLANLEQAGEALPDRALPVRRAAGGTPFSSPFSAMNSPPPVPPLTSPLGVSNHGAAEGAGVKHKPPSPWVETRRKRSVAPQVPAVVSE